MKFISKLLGVCFVSFALFAQAHESSGSKAVILTSKGEIEVTLFDKEAPKSVENFASYAQSGFYEDTIFHRVISGFMIQGGGLDEKMKKKSTLDPIDNEANNKILNKRGTVSMARTSSPHSATSQFFINLADNDFLDHVDESSPQKWGYAVFGEVTRGMEVVDIIAAVQTGKKKGHADVPEETVKIISVKVTLHTEEEAEGVPVSNVKAKKTAEEKATTE